jgi:hypothetical protein
MEVLVIDRITTHADLRLLPALLQQALNTDLRNTHNFRRVEQSNKAARKARIQYAITEALKAQAITERLAIEILIGNNAYGTAGKAAIAAAK